MTNRIMVAGNLVAAAEVKAGADNREQLVFTVASNDGDYTEYFPCSVWGEAGFANNVLPFLKLGQTVSIKGEIVYPEKTEKEGTVYQNILVSIRGLRHVKLLGAAKKDISGDNAPAPSPDASAAHKEGAQAAQAAQPAPDYDSFDDDIPFGK